jgi:hypothetical protein
MSNHRPPTTKVHAICRECGSDRVIVDVPVYARRGIQRVHLRKRDAEGASETLMLTRSKICTECGHIAWFLHPEGLREIESRHTEYEGDLG